ncbi:MAG: hypothetical protein HQL40_06050 [Alphaproteobacteria bacterium]|nr:hypothetical protein [Alphaproteobacteria bacterium]
MANTTSSFQPGNRTGQQQGPMMGGMQQQGPMMGGMQQQGPMMGGMQQQGPMGGIGQATTDGGTTRGGGGPRRAGGPPSIELIETWVGEVLTAGGISLPDGAETFLDGVADNYEAVVEADGSLLSRDYCMHLKAVVSDLETLAEDGDVALATVASGYPNDTMLSLAIHKIDEFVDFEGVNLSTEVVTRLETAQASLETVYADGVLSEAEKTTVAAAAVTVESILTDSFTKISDTGLAAFSSDAADLRTLLSTGFLALDAADRALFETAASDIAALDALSDAARGWGVHEVVDSLRFDYGGHYLALADSDKLSGGMRGQGVGQLG